VVFAKMVEKSGILTGCGKRLLRLPWHLTRWHRIDARMRQHHSRGPDGMRIMDDGWTFDVSDDDVASADLIGWLQRRRWRRRQQQRTNLYPTSWRLTDELEGCLRTL